MSQFLIINDLPASGQVAGMIMQSILTAGYLKTAWLPTVLLSHHTGNGPVYRKEVTNEMQSILKDWKNKQINFSGIVTGYFGNEQQIHYVIDYLEQSSPTLPVIVDPVMADNGKFYQGFNEQILSSMRQLAKKAHVILPNVTEACFLANLTMPKNLTQRFIQNLLESLKKENFHQVILTGVVLEDSLDKVGFYYLDDHDQLKSFTHQRSNRHYFGTGDLSTAIFSTFYFKGHSIELALEKMCEWLPIAIEATEQNLEINVSKAMFEIMNYFKEGENNEKTK